MLRNGCVALGLLLVLVVPASADTILYVAVPDAAVSPGIHRVVDMNDDQDALDPGEVTLFASGAFTDVAASATGVLYAIRSSSAKVWRIEDKNSDDDALDPGEVTIFRSDSPSIASGLLLERPTSLATADFFDPFLGASRTYVYTMDVVLQKGIRLDDGDLDEDANDANEISVQDTFDVAFTPERMVTDRAGRVVATNANRLSLVRLEDLNGDGSFQEIVTECPQAACGPGLAGDFHVIRSYQPAQTSKNLEGPFGVAALSGGGWLVSDPGSGYVFKLTDMDLDGDAQSANEIGFYMEIGTTYDIATDEREVAYLGVEYGPNNVWLLEDRNGDGDAFDDGERRDYASVPGTPLGLAVQPPLDTRVLVVEAEAGFERSPLKGPVLVVEDGVTTTARIRIVDEHGSPAAFERVGNGVPAGCFSVCSDPLYETDAEGFVEYEVERTAPSDGPESLKFWVKEASGGTPGYSDNVLFVPVISTPCTPDPVADAGPDLFVASGAAVVLNGASTGEGLRYCWMQTGGLDLGLGECDDELQSIGFTAPDASGELTFEFESRNGCDIFSGPDQVSVFVNGIFADGFETGDACAWSETTHPLCAP